MERHIVSSRENPQIARPMKNAPANRRGFNTGEIQLAAITREQRRLLNAKTTELVTRKCATRVVNCGFESVDERIDSNQAQKAERVRLHPLRAEIAKAIDDGYQTPGIPVPLSLPQVSEGTIFQKTPAVNGKQQSTSTIPHTYINSWTTVGRVGEGDYAAPYARVDAAIAAESPETIDALEHQLDVFQAKNPNAVIVVENGSEEAMQAIAPTLQTTPYAIIQLTILDD